FNFGRSATRTSKTPPETAPGCESLRPPDPWQSQLFRGHRDGHVRADEKLEGNRLHHQPGPRFLECERATRPCARRFLPDLNGLEQNRETNKSAIPFPT